MKFKLSAFILALAIASWAQTSSQNPPTPVLPEGTASHAKADCACCDKMTGAKEEKSCCQHKMAGKEEKAMSCCSEKEASACCGGKDAKSGMTDDKDKAAVAACGDSCGKSHEKGCCANHKKGDKMAMNCCGEGQCGKHCASHGSVAAGN